MMFNTVLVILCLLALTCQTEIIEGKESVKREKRDSQDLIIVIPMNNKTKKQFVDIHNDLRRQVTPSAANMRMISWDDELANLIESHVRTCEWGHSTFASRSHTVFSQNNQGGVGENLDKAANIMNVANSSTEAWYNEVKYYTYNTASCQQSKMCGHYTQVVWADSYKVGCAIAYCRNFLGGSSGYYVGCDYGPSGNIKYADGNGKVMPLKPYISGTPCSNCSGNFSGCYDGLCVDPLISATDAPTTAKSTVTASSIQTTSAATNAPTAAVSTVTSSSQQTTTTGSSCSITKYGELLTWTLALSIIFVYF